MVLLKRLSDAQRDGDRILAVIRGTAANQDGRTRNIATPSVDAQVAVYRAALAAAGVDAATVGTVEAHGTGTPVGDPIEFTSLATVYGTTGPSLLGSAKTNFGHTESASGALGFVKAVLALQHGVVPPNGALPPHCPRRWPQSRPVCLCRRRSHRGRPARRPRRARCRPTACPAPTSTRSSSRHRSDRAAAGRCATPHVPAPLLFPLSSTSAEELRAHRRPVWPTWLEHQPDPVSLTDLAYTLARRRAHRTGAHRPWSPNNLDELAQACSEVADGDTPYPASGRAGRPRTGVGVLRPGFAVGADGRRAAGDRAGIRRRGRRARAADRARSPDSR